MMVIRPRQGREHGVARWCSSLKKDSVPAAMFPQAFLVMFQLSKKVFLLFDSLLTLTTNTDWSSD